MKNYDVVIIGAGSIGVPLSFYLSRKGLKIAVIEKNHSAGRGQNRAAIGGIRATHSDPAKIHICKQSLEIVSRFKENYGYDISWFQGGYLFPVYTQKDEMALIDLLTVQHEHNLNIYWADREEVEARVPGIYCKGLRGGTFSPEDGSASPLKLIDAYTCLARDSGVDFFFNESVGNYERNNKKIHAVKTNKDTYTAGIFVDASGADSRELNAKLGLDVPVFPDSHEGGITEPVKRFFEPMIVDIRPGKGSSNFYFYQNDEGQVVFCITPEPPIKGKDCENTSEFLPMVSRRMVELYPRLRHLRVRRIWRGLYPMTPDGFPLVGWAPGFENYFLLAGMCGQGFMLGPGLGAITAEIFTEQSTQYDHILHQLRPDRSFSQSEMLK
ncbi:TPA: sulfurtransferase [Candidatus Marinimicrobia bacterium]|nr:MAG: Putative oxidoreductase [Marinimicrobia bacterium 46_47]KUK91745.1 MAG: putative oxidoreductase [Marinimicrobia bacterium 46_43]HAE86716.1 sulfurtransferase [Candidatus Neomarinimicrobiota bacterium]HBY18357.1 sulfurtransferase [Candidatus Neomarinimicrobiota bacterium]